MALWVVVLAAGGGLLTAPAAHADLAPGAWGADTGLAIATDAEAAYVRAKSPYEVRRGTGGLARVAREGGAPSAAPFPTVAGTVKVIESDGAGGWIVGGTFRYVGGVRRHNLARILSDGRVDPGFAPSVPPVVALARAGTTVYVSAGRDEGSEPIAAYDLANGQALPGWSPRLEGVAWDLAVAGDELYAAGDLSTAGSDDDRSVLQLDPRTGARTAWDSGARGRADNLAVSATTVYAEGGSVLTDPVTGDPIHLAAFDRATGRRTVWAPDVSSVSSLAVAGDTVYLGGARSADDGSTPAVSAVDAVSGAATDWAPGITGTARTIRVQDDRVVIGGRLARAGEGEHRGAFAVSRTTGEVLDWDPQTRGEVEDIALAGTDVVVGGRFAALAVPLPDVGGILRVLPDGTLDTDWRSPPMLSVAGSSDVTAMEVAGDTLYAAGGEWVVGGRRASGIAAFDRRTGARRDFDARVAGPVDAVVPHGDRLYITGFFGSVAGVERNRVAAVDRHTGELLPWDPAANGAPKTAISDGRRLYVGGRFDWIAGTARPGVAAFDLATGALDPTFAPTHVRDVRTLAPFGDRLYVSGTIADYPAPNDYRGLVALDTKDGSVLPWLPDVEGGQGEIVPGADTVWIAGAFSRVDGVDRRGLAALDAKTGRLRLEPDTDLADNPTESGPYALRSFGGRLVIGGQFTGVGDRPTGGVAFVDADLGVPPPPDTTPPADTGVPPAAGDPPPGGADTGNPGSTGPPLGAPFPASPAPPSVGARPGASPSAPRSTVLRQLTRAAARALRGRGLARRNGPVRTGTLPAGTVRVSVRSVGSRRSMIASGSARRSSTGRYAVRLRTTTGGWRALRRGPVRASVTVTHVGTTSVVTRVASTATLGR
ncbi:delta-60 repeat domain-containing protein [Patulibacter americanus]|uniref:delta-60 repeat domain-containing protein n=1 Tax=Patulibacter americanus TaxID=588672 RepID=UPI0003B64DD0|nr:delta-60 repeat domain-containing protein [Patulibacter americanus]